MAKLKNLLALLRRRALKPLWMGGLALLAMALMQLGAMQLAQAQQSGNDFDHSSTGFVLNAQHQNVRCETCHLKGVFKGTPKDCASCHGWNNPRATFSVMPVNHIPTGNAPCESCHQANMAQFADAALTFNHVAVKTLACLNCHSPANPHPGVRTSPPDATHAAVLAQGQACDKCHTTIQFTGPKIPNNHIPIAAVSCTNCHTDADYAKMPTLQAIHENAPSSSTNCQQCHSSAAASAYSSAHMVPPIKAPPDNHIGMNGQACETCHLVAGSGVQLPVGNSAKFTNAKFNHGGVSTGCTSCHGSNGTSLSFFGINNIIPMPSSSGSGPTAHIPTAAACETCHKPAPSGLLAANATATVPGTGFQLLKPSSADIHANMSVSCAACHEAGLSWVGMDLYGPRTASLNASVAQPYIGFQTRPNIGGGGYSIADPAHQTGGDCATCHTINDGFLATNLPSNHIPIVATAACATCHKTGDYKVMPGLTDIHANARAGTTCAQCHGDTTTYPMTPVITAPPANHIAMNGQACDACHVAPGSDVHATVVDGDKFSKSGFVHTGIQSGCATCHGDGVVTGTYAGITPKNRIGLAPSHIASSQVCEDCHTSVPAVQIPFSGGTAPNTFAGGQFNHKGVSSGCDACHGASVSASSFYGVSATSLVVRPTTFATSGHLPTTASCESCHTAPSGLISVTLAHSVPGSQFSSPLPTPGAIHSGVSGSCNTCHEAGMNWIGVSGYTRAPTQYIANASYTGFHTRPTPGGGGYSVADLSPHPPGPTDCSACHLSFDYFSTPVAPAHHIPYVANTACGACHVSFGTAPTIANIHAYIQNPSGNCQQCHSAAAAKEFAPTTTLRPIVPPIGNHVPMGSAGCETCHVGAGTSLAPGVWTEASRFSGSAFSHTGVNVSCATCHAGGASYYGISSIVLMPATSPAGTSSHMPTSATCDSCHVGVVPTGLSSVTAIHNVPGSLFQNPAPTSIAIHSGVTTCNNCHEAGMTWMGMGMADYRRNPPSYTGVATDLYTGFHTRPVSGGTITSVDDAAHLGTGECSQCHGNTIAFGAPVKPDNHIPFDANVGCAACHGNFSSLPKVSAIHLYSQSIVGCDQCHSTAKAAFYSTGMKTAVVTVPDLHISMGGLGCEGCHVGAGSSVASALVPDGAKFSGSLFNHASSTVSCATCHGATVTASTFKGVYPKTIGNLAPAHVPTTAGAACDTCHTNGAPTGLVPALGMTTFANAQFLHPAANTGCEACHGPNISNSSFYGINPIIVMPSTAAPSGHLPTSTTCENCHASSKPTALIPASSTRNVPGSLFQAPAPDSVTIHNDAKVSCNSCHEAGLSWMGMNLLSPPRTTSGTGNYYGFQTRPLLNASGYSVADGGHPDQSSGDCSLCHGDTLAFGQPSQPNGHIPYVANTACATCHVKFGTAPTVGVIHTYIQSTTSNCQQCHDSANVGQFKATTTLKPIQTQDSSFNNHIPLGGLDCSACHMGAGTSMPAGSVPEGSKFSGSAFIHTGITTNCGDCHGSGVAAGTFYGVTPKSIYGLTPRHIPTSSNVGCEICHANSIPPGLVPSTGYTGSPSFSGGQFIHTDFTTGCAACHGATITNSSFKGVSSLVVMQTSGANAHIPTTAACENCHSGSGSIPAGLLSVTAAHPVPGSGFNVSPPDSPTIHSNVTGTCASCHEAGLSWVGVASAYPRNQTSVQTNNPNYLYTGFHTRPMIANATGTSMLDIGHPDKGDCSQCHGNTDAFGAASLPTPHIPYNGSANCAACHTAWGTPPTITAIHANLPTNSACADCHSRANADTYSSNATRAVVGPDAAKHVPMRSQTCESCHTSSLTLPMPLTAKFSGSSFSHGSNMTSNCAECHGPAITGASFQGITSIVMMPPSITAGATSHIPSSTTCEDCHRNAMPTALVPGNAPHAAPNSGFLLQPPKTDAIHAGVSGSCNTCHEKGMDWMGMAPYLATQVAPYHGFQTRPYGTKTNNSVQDSLHPVDRDCSDCHSGFTVWEATAKPLNHIPTASVTCGTCHTNPDYGVWPSNALTHANAPVNAKCADCHSAANAAYYSTSKMTVVGASDGSTTPVHIPMANLDCADCHVGGSSSMTSATQNGAKFSNSGFSHANATASCASCHSGVTPTTFQGGIVPVSMTAPVLSPIHVPNPAGTDCGVCHLNVPVGQSKIGNTSTTFAAGQYSHAGIAKDCATCHGSNIGNSSFKGITKIVVLPAGSAGTSTNDHIPLTYSGTACETCHLGSMPSTLVPAVSTTTTLGATKFKYNGLQPPDGPSIHTGVSGACAACHEAGKVWLDLSLYPRNFTTLQPASTPPVQYKGFQTRPTSTGGGNSITDGNHPGGSAECAGCHGSTESFSAVDKNANHIPYSATAQCQNCHTNLASNGSGGYVSSSINFALPRPSIANIHQYAQSTTSNCEQCHSETNASYMSIAASGSGANAIPAYIIKSPITDGIVHIPYGNINKCDVCHVYKGGPLVTPVTGGTFAGGKFDHTSIGACEACHGDKITGSTFKGVTAIVAIPKSSPTPSATTHIPYAVACAACHTKNIPSGLVGVTSTGSLFASPAPVDNSTIHSNLGTLSCTDCHERGAQWLGMGTYYKPSPGVLNLSVLTTQYTGFQTRPGSAATPFGYADAKHTGTSSLDGGNCTSCHGSSTTSFIAAGKPPGHMPTTNASCADCHVTSATSGDYSYASSSVLSVAGIHKGISAVPASYTAPAAGAQSCNTCHTIGAGGTSGTAPFAGCKTQSNTDCSSAAITYQPMITTGLGPVTTATITHVPTATKTGTAVLSCDACHSSTSTFANTTMGSAGHANAKTAGMLCSQCHEDKLAWTNVKGFETRTPSKHTSTKQKIPNECDGGNCHSYASGFHNHRSLLKPVMRSAHVNPDMSLIRPNTQGGKLSRGSLGNSYDHKGVEAGKCKTCHDGKSASGMPARHLMVGTSCDTCHRPTTWLPAQFNHNGVSANTCQACHNGMNASGRPAGHFNTTRSCDNCHKNMSWLPANYHHISPLYVASPDKLTCISCHVTNGELIRRQLRGLTRTKPIPVGP